jgi:hypothetical protein
VRRPEGGREDNMILERRIFKAKLGCLSELVALARPQCEATGIPYRIYTPLSGPANIVVFEFQFENLAKEEKFWAEQRAKPDVAAYVAKRNALLENETSIEFCTVL